MKLIFAIIAAFTGLLVAAPAMADGTACEAQPQLTSYSPNVADLKRRASFINLWWNSDEAKGMTFEQKKAQRSKDIDDFFGSIEESRRDAYRNASCLVVATKKCASTPGHKHECPMAYSPPANMRFRKDTLKPIDDDFTVPPHFVGENVEFTNKKTGEGSNTDGFQAVAEFTPEYVDAAVKSELAQVHSAVDSLFDSVLPG